MAVLAGGDELISANKCSCILGKVACEVKSDGELMLKRLTTPASASAKSAWNEVIVSILRASIATHFNEWQWM